MGANALSFIITFCCAVAWAKPPEYREALALAEAAQESFINGDMEQMHTLLLDAFQKYPNDPVVAKNLAEFAKIYYFTNPNLAPAAASNEFTPTFVRASIDGKLSFSFNITSRANPADEIEKAFIILPNGVEVEAVGPSTEVSRYPSSGVAGKIVVRGDTNPIPGPLPTGIFTYVLTLKGNREFRYPVILWPDNDSKTLSRVEVDRESQKLSWTVRTLHANDSDIEDSATFYLYGSNSYRPIWSKYIPISSDQPQSGSETVPQIADGSSILLNIFEVYSTGYPAIFYENSIKNSY